MTSPRSPVPTLRFVKAVHTAVWGFFVGCILGIPLLASRGSYRGSLVLAGLVLVEVLVLAANRWRCPLTNVAARYTDDRGDNFDIYLPVWIARYNKQIFGSLFVIGVAFTLWRWLSRG